MECDHTEFCFHALFSFLFPPVLSLGPSLHISQFDSVLSKTGRPQEFLFFLFKTGTKAVGQHSEVTAYRQSSIPTPPPPNIIVTLKYKGAALKIRKKKSQNNMSHYNKYKHSLGIEDEPKILPKWVWIQDKPIASTMRVYAAWVSLSSPTTVRTIPSLKPTLNLPSWFPPTLTEHKQL